MVAHAPLRHFLCLTAHTVYRSTEEIRADQQQVWDEVRRASRRAEISSTTEAVGEVYSSLREKVKEVLERMKEAGLPLPKQVGLIDKHCGRCSLGNRPSPKPYRLGKSLGEDCSKQPFWSIGQGKGGA